MTRILKYKRPIALFFLAVFSIQLFTPSVAHALTSGPSQPEMKGFEPIGTSDMVDLFSGDFTYNIPLLDVGGYPVNMAYHSGSGMDDEASWVGLGWSLNPGSVNRQLRGLPDDFKGDVVTKEFNTKDNVTYGAKVSASPEAFGFGHASFDVGVFKNSLRGIGVETGGSIGVGLTGSIGGDLSVGVHSNSQQGIEHSATLSLSVQKKVKDNLYNKVGMSIGSSYNSRAGITGLTLSGSISQDRQLNEAQRKTDKKGEGSVLMGSNSSSYSYAGQTYTPSAPAEYNTESYTLSAHGGPVAWAFMFKFGATGYYNRQKVASKITTRNAYGFLWAENGKRDINGMMDFNRENDIPYDENLPALPLPVATQDLFSVTSQGGSSQFRAFRNGSGIFFDPRARDKSSTKSLGVEIGGGAYFQAGVDTYGQDVKTNTNKWESNNDYKDKGDFQDADPSDQVFEPVYFKRSGEKTATDAAYINSINGSEPVDVVIDRNDDRTSAKSRFRTAAGEIDIAQPIKRNKREIRNHVFSYLTAADADRYSLNKGIPQYPLNQISFTGSTANLPVKPSYVAAGVAQPHHIGEITITEGDGSRYKYGVPVYNTYQEDATFNVDPAGGDVQTGLVNFTAEDASINNKKGRDRYYSKEIIPPYAHAYLLSAILSSDYVDVTNNGVSDDDLGNAVKFNYSKAVSNFGWRTPTVAGKANYNQGMLSDTRDDKASYSYGKKDLWYMQSIESKTMLAVFYTGTREDALGVKDKMGVADLLSKQRCLDSIVLYSKADLVKNGKNAIPIKTVHFEYDYSACPGVPNNSGAAVMKDGVNINGNKGKLTLKKVYFTFGRNNKGFLNPYQFEYNLSTTNGVVNYGYKQVDRWGMFKSSNDNPNQLRNDEFPYSTQDKEKADTYAALWQMSRIKLPSGGEIKVNYESDDYAYVQDQRAQSMCFISGIGQPGKSNGLIDANEILVKLPVPVQSKEEMMWRYFEGISNLYYRCYTDLDNKGHSEYVPGYATISGVRMVDSQTAAISLEKTDGKNPIAKAAWQFLRMNIPQYAYPGYDTNDEDGGDALTAIKSLVIAVGQIRELFENFDASANRQHYGDQLDLNKSWVRLCNPSLTKLGGGNRVKSVRISDNWQQMSGNAGMDAAYGQDYEYTTNYVDKQGVSRTISSGVTPYEPQIGNDENPLKQPLIYKHKGAPLALNTYSYIELPLGESFYTSPGVGYSRVLVRNVGADNSNYRTGYNVSEFYTAKDFPVSVKQLPINNKNYKPNLLLSFLKIKNKSVTVASQGYAIMVNDMHGKPRQESVFDRGGSEISSVEYLYKTDNPDAARKTLNNDVMLIQPDGTMKDGRIGEDVELYSDMREQETNNLGVSVKVSWGSFPLFFFPGFYVFPGVGFDKDERQFRSTATVKVINRFGLVQKVIKRQNGSSVSTENLAWDGETGEVILTKSQNEFDDPVYNFSYPAYWAYNGMGAAYKNIDVVIKNFNSPDGMLSNPQQIFQPGDEFIASGTNTRLWAVPTDDGRLMLVNQGGVRLGQANATLRLVRSGKRNMMNAAVGAFTSLRNPVKAGKLDFTAFTQVIDASANTFKQEWQVPLRSNFCGCPVGYTLSEDKQYCQKWDTIPAIPITDVQSCAAQNEAYSLFGAFIYDKGFRVVGTGPGQAIPAANTFWSNAGRKDTLGPLNRSGVWVCSSGAIPDLEDNVFAGFHSINIPESKWYYVGFGADNVGRLKVNGIPILDQDPDSISLQHTGVAGNIDRAFLIWHIYPVYLEAGVGSVEMEGANYGNAASFGAEIYNNTKAEIMAATSYADLDTVFSTRNMRGKNFENGGANGYVCPQGYTSVMTPDGVKCIKIAQQTVVSPDVQINPYATGVLGNWRSWQQYVYHTDRTNLPGNLAKGSTNIRKSGTYTSVTPFWTFDPSSGLFSPTGEGNDRKWVLKNEITKYNAKGAEVETKDALGQYASVLFGYLQSLPIAVASNAQQTEIGYDGFEDYSFSGNPDLRDSCNLEGHFDFRKLLLQSITPTTAAAHTGLYSLKLSAPAIMKRYTNTPGTGIPYTYSDNTTITTNRFTALQPFSPLAEVKYLLSVWVKNDAITTATTGIVKVYSGTTEVAASTEAGPSIEGWRKVKLVFASAPGAGSELLIQLNPQGGDTYFDDIRVQPLTGVMKSFVYNPFNLRLMAGLDENNYATFYEYDDEGTLIRVKKETERGIMTLKETRSNQKSR